LLVWWGSSSNVQVKLNWFVYRCQLSYLHPCFYDAVAVVSATRKEQESEPHRHLPHGVSGDRYPWYPFRQARSGLSMYSRSFIKTLILFYKCLSITDPVILFPIGRRRGLHAVGTLMVEEELEVLYFKSDIRAYQGSYIKLNFYSLVDDQFLRIPSSCVFSTCRYSAPLSWRYRSRRIFWPIQVASSTVNSILIQ
jgi:hypothetical protein